MVDVTLGALLGYAMGVLGVLLVCAVVHLTRGPRK